MRRRVIISMMLMTLVLVTGCSKTSEGGNEDETTTVEEMTDSYDLMMSYVEQIQEEFTEEEIVAIMGEPDIREGSGIEYQIYCYGDYEVRIVYCSDGFILDIFNTVTKEITEVYPVINN